MGWQILKSPSERRQRGRCLLFLCGTLRRIDMNNPLGGRQKNRLVTLLRWVSEAEWVGMKRTNAPSAVKNIFLYFWQRCRDVCGVESLNNTLLCGATCYSSSTCSEKWKWILYCHNLIWVFHNILFDNMTLEVKNDTRLIRT